MGPSLIHLSHAVAYHDDRIRTARKHHAAPLAAPYDHMRERELVQASFLPSRRENRSTHRRWA